MMHLPCTLDDSAVMSGTSKAPYQQPRKLNMPFRRGSKGTMGTCCLSLLVGVSGTRSSDSFDRLAKSTDSRTDRCEVATTSVV